MLSVPAEALLFVITAVAFIAILAAMWLLREHVAIHQRLLAADKRTEQVSDQLFAATERLERQQRIIETQGDLVVRRDLAGVISMVNPAYAAVAGKPSSDLIGSSFALTALEQQWARHGVASEADDHLPGEGAPRSVAWSAIPLHDRNGHLVERVLIGRDITERRRAEAASDAKSRFLATVSHEIRTPLNGVLGMADLLGDTSLSGEQMTYVRAIRTSGEALLSLIEEILDFSKIEAGKAEISAEPFDLRPLAEGVVELLAPRAQGKGIEIALSVDAAMPAKVVGDGSRIRQILLNLAGNAVKFTDQGGVGVHLSFADGNLHATISDTGPGIAADRLATIFAEFEQGDTAAAANHGGTGLGLAISQRLAVQMGGNISVESKVGEGAVFRLQLPLAVGDSTEGEAGAQPTLIGRHVLVVSSGPFEGRFIERELQARKATVQRVASAASALAALTRTAFDTVIIDCGIGDHETRELAAVARRAGVASRVVLLSPYERRQFGSPTESGFESYLIKPVRARSLVSRLGGLAAVHGETQTQGHEGNTKSANAAKSLVLLAEDNDINALLATRLLEKGGAQVVHVKDGEAALARLLAGLSGAGPRFTAALLDMRMPGLDGRQVAKQYRDAEAAAGVERLPLVAVTANAFAEDRRLAMDHGFDVFLAKPLDRHALQRVMGDIAAVHTGKQAA